MKLSGLHLLLTYQCNLECDHCFVWGAPEQDGVMTLECIREILKQAEELGTIEWIYFEGGEPFLYYVPLLKGVQLAARLGFQVGLVSNAYWATSKEDALAWLRPFSELVQDLSISGDRYHFDEKVSQQARNACAAAEELEIPVGVIRIAEPEMASAVAQIGKLPVGESAVMYRGRAAEKLLTRANMHPWTAFSQCPHEDLREPGRVHVDPFGNLHLCQGISVGNLFRTPLGEICKTYNPDSHPITGPLCKGGPAELVRRFALPHKEAYVDACHLCYEARSSLRSSFPDVLGPDQMYGLPSNRPAGTHT
jgi:hypothetical protein